jgi:capsular exopolysaccharide synthesis family protein
MEFWNLYRIIRKRLWMVLFLVVVTVSGTLASVLAAPPAYKATATVRVAIASPSVADVGRLDWFTAGILFSTIQETVLSRTILQEVIDQNVLGMTTEEFRTAIGVSRVGNSNLLKIDAKSTEPEMAKRLANEIAATFIRSNQRLLDSQSASSVSFYEEQLKIAEQNYNRARDDFRESLNQPNARAAENRFITAQAAYQAALDKLEAVRLINRFPDLRPASVTIGEPAVTPTEPEGRQLARYTLIALLVSLMLGIFIAMGLEYLDPSIKSPYEVTRALGLPVIGSVPHFGRGVSGFSHVLANLELPLVSPLMRWRIGKLESKVVAPDELPLDSSEAFRNARVGLVAAHRRQAAQGQLGATTALITSSRPRDGRTTITANLGIALARAGYRVLLVEGDLRRPQLHQHLGVDAGGPGLVQVLEREATLLESIKPTSYSRLEVLLSGVATVTAEEDQEDGQPMTRSQGQNELLDSDWFSEVLAQIARSFHFVLVDSPPLGVFTDGALMASRLGRALFVVDATRPSAENEQRSLALLHSVGATVEGVIVNKINPDYVNPMKLHSLPLHIVEQSAFHEQNGDGSNGHGTNGHAATAGAARRGR